MKQRERRRRRRNGKVRRKREMRNGGAAAGGGGDAGRARADGGWAAGRVSALSSAAGVSWMGVGRCEAGCESGRTSVYERNGRASERARMGRWPGWCWCWQVQNVGSGGGGIIRGSGQGAVAMVQRRSQAVQQARQVAARRVRLHADARLRGSRWELLLHPGARRHRACAWQHARGGGWWLGAGCWLAHASSHTAAPAVQSAPRPHLAARLAARPPPTVHRPPPPVCT